MRADKSVRFVVPISSLQTEFIAGTVYTGDELST
jgi:hypothetical protein